MDLWSQKVAFYSKCRFICADTVFIQKNDQCMCVQHCWINTLKKFSPGVINKETSSRMHWSSPLPPLTSQQISPILTQTWSFASPPASTSPPPTAAFRFSTLPNELIDWHTLAGRKKGSIEAWEREDEVALRRYTTIATIYHIKWLKIRVLLKIQNDNGVYYRSFTTVLPHIVQTQNES